MSPRIGIGTWRVGALLAALALLLTTTGVPTARAHVSLAEASPGAGSELEVAPSEIVLRFDEPVEPAGEPLTLTDGEGVEHRLEVRPGAEATRLRAHVPPEAAPGEHALAWRVVARDGHVAEGGFAYRVAGPSVPDEDGPAAGDAEGTPDGDAGTGTGEASSAAGELDDPEGATGADDGSGTRWLVAIALVAVTAALAAVLGLGRRRSPDATS